MYIYVHKVVRALYSTKVIYIYIYMYIYKYKNIEIYKSCHSIV